MANTKSAIKNARKSQRRMMRNKAVKSSLKTLERNLQAAIKAGDGTATRTSAIAYVSAIDRAARRGIVHPNAAAHVKSSAAKYVFAK